MCVALGQARLAAQRYVFQYQEAMPVEQLVQRVCNYKQAYTQYGGLRPFGVVSKKQLQYTRCVLVAMVLLDCAKVHERLARK